MTPNFLIFITDQHRADHLGCYGNPIVQTPNIDAIAAGGTRFSRAYVSNPVCMPNRGSIMTSRMPSVHGARGNGIPLPLESVTFADLLSEAGYRTVLIGKSHLQNMEDKPPLLPPVIREKGTKTSAAFPEARRATADEADYEQEMRSRWSDPSHKLKLPYYGFQDVVLCNHHADECFGDWLRWLESKDPVLAKQVGREHGVRDVSMIAPQAWRTQLDELSYPTHFIAEQSAGWLTDHMARAPDQPFAMVCSFPDPHHPWTPPGRYWDMYDPSDMPIPSTLAEGGDAARHVAWLRRERQAGDANVEGPRLFSASAREIQEITALTYGMITNIDDRIGIVLDALRKSGADRNTVVVFTSDHGDLMGDHGIVLKGPLHYQGLVRVPFIWQDPTSDGAGSVREDLVSSIDLGTTILRRAGIAQVNGMQGKALFSTSGQAMGSDRDAVLIEENQQRAYLGFESPVRLRTLVTKTHRLSVFAEGDWGELYDLHADPLEEHNLWEEASASALKLALMHRLVQMLIEHGDTSPKPSRVA